MTGTSPFDHLEAELAVVAITTTEWTVAADLGGGEQVSCVTPRLELLR